MPNKQIKPEVWYTMADIVSQRMFYPWAYSVRTVRNVVKNDVAHGSRSILKPNIVGTGYATKYHFRGRNIIAFIKAVEANKITLDTTNTNKHEPTKRPRKVHSSSTGR